jgi:predicted anti-sigma-YlaC factor YlaD
VKCTECQLLIPEYLDAKLPETDRASLAEHLALCPDCRNEVEEFRSMLQLLPSRALEQPEPVYWGSILPRINARVDRQRRSWLPAWRLRIAMPVLSAALLVILVIFSLPREASMSSTGSGLGNVAESDLLAFMEQQLVLGATETSGPSGKVTAAEDLPVLKALLKGESNIASYLDTEQGSLDETLPERDVDQLIPVLAKSYPVVVQNP